MAHRGNGLSDIFEHDVVVRDKLSTSSGTVQAVPTNPKDLVNKEYVDGLASGLWEVDGTETQLITADEIDMQTKKILNVVDPTADQEAATKKYVDDNETVEVNDLGVAVTWANVPNANITEASVTQHVGAIDHDSLLNYAANQHFTQAAIDHTGILNIGANTHAQVDNHIADVVTNPHAVTITNVLLDGLNHTDTVTGAPASGSIIYRTGGNWTPNAAGTRQDVLTLGAGGVIPVWRSVWDYMHYPDQGHLVYDGNVQQFTGLFGSMLQWNNVGGRVVAAGNDMGFQTGGAGPGPFNFGGNGMQFGYTEDLQLPRLYAKFTTGPSITAQRIFIGWTSTTLNVMTTLDNPPGDYIGLAYSTNRGDINWQVIEKDNTTQTVTNTGIAVAANQNLMLEMIYLNTQSIQVNIHQPAVGIIYTATHNTTPPRTTVNLGFAIGMDDTGAGARQFFVGGCATQAKTSWVV